MIIDFVHNVEPRSINHALQNENIFFVFCPFCSKLCRFELKSQ